MEQHCYDLAIRVLVSKEDEKFVAHALELDLLAYGDSEDEARKELQATMFAQLSFAAHMEKSEMIDHPAPKEYFDRWDKANRLALAGIVCPDKAAGLKTKAVFFSITPDELRSIHRKKSGGFTRVPESASAAA